MRPFGFAAARLAGLDLACPFFALPILAGAAFFLAGFDGFVGPLARPRS